jgi:predicted TIM-barrel fold metal-dependent hydrolase
MSHGHERREEPMILVSADGHCGARPEMYRPYLESRYWEALDQLKLEDAEWVGLPQFREPEGQTLSLIDDREAIRAGGREGAWDFDRRLRELDAEGVAGEVIKQGHQLAAALWFGLESMQPYPPELRSAGCRAFHRWAADGIAGSGGRLLGVADAGPCLDMEATVAELIWASNHGFAAVTVPGTPEDPELPPLYDPYYDPFWRTCDERGLRLFVHAGYGGAQGRLARKIKQAKKFGIEVVADESQEIEMARARRVFWQMLLGGVFDRYPGLKVVFTELHAHWVPGMLTYLDDYLSDADVELRAKPSEYFRGQCMLTPSSIRSTEVAMRHDIGVELLMFGMDYPHPEGTWPNTGEWIRATFGYQAVPEDEARAILGENALEFFGFDRQKLTAVAERIGPKPAELLKPGSTIDPAKITHFHERSGFNKPIDNPMGWDLKELLDSDLAACSASKA